MGQFTPTKIILSDINSGEKYLDGDIVTADAINAPLEASAYAQEKAEEALVKADFALAQVNGAINPEYALSFNSVYPIGSVYITTKSSSPSELFNGTWELIQDCFLYASGKLSVEDAGGSKKITRENLPTNITGEILTNSNGGANGIIDNNNSGMFTPAYPTTNASYATGTYSSGEGYRGLKFDLGGKGEDYMPPYLVVYMWKRVA